MDEDDFLHPDDWDECWNCGGAGWIAGCFEDTCSCLGDQDDVDTCCAPRRCDVCRGEGGWERTAPARLSRTGDQS